MTLDHTTPAVSRITPPFTLETARAKAKAAENACNSRDPQIVAQAYTEDSEWRNRTEFFKGREAIKAFLKPIEFRIIYLQRKQPRLLPESHHQGGALAHPLERATRMDAQLGEGARAEVG
jgi:hypothetical protein